MRYFNRNGPAVRVRDNEGQLRTVGYQWAECVDSLFPSFTAISVFLFGWAAFSVFDRNASILFTAKLIAAGLAAAAVVYFCATKERAVLFDRDGKVRFPFSTFGGSLRPWSYHREHHDITSIEVLPHAPSRHTYCVGFFTVHGETCVVSAELSSAQARLVAVQLTRALKEIRDSMATVEQFARPQQARQAAPAVIE